MRRLISFVAVLLLLASAAPVMACVTAGLAMSHEESACCRSMHGQCGEMVKQGCCQTVVHKNSPQVATESATLAVHWTVLAQGDSLTGPVMLDNPTRPMFLVEHSPPGLVIAHTTVLQI